ncbi:MAG: hypothetical protein WCK70_06475 [Chloroflexales bacterium]
MELLLGIVLIAGIAWYALSRSHTPPQLNMGNARDAARRTTQQVETTSRELLGKLRGRFDRTADHESFKSWVLTLVDAVPGDGTLAAAFRAWIGELALADLKTFRKQLASFCETLDIENEWLHKDHLGQRPEMRRALEETVGLYALAYARGAGQEGDIARTRIFQRWVVAPDRMTNRDFGTKLYTALVTKGLATPPPEMLLAPEKQRRDFANQAIREAAAHDPQAFDAVLAEMLNPTPKAPPAVETPPHQVVIPADPSPAASSRRTRNVAEA